MTRSEQAEWFIAVEGEPFGPVSAARLSERVLGGKVLPEDLVWCDGMADWLPLSATMGKSEKPRPTPLVYEIDVEAAERRELAARVSSLSQLYLDKLVELGVAKPRRPVVLINGAGGTSEIAPSSAAARYIEAEPLGARAQSSGRLVEDASQRGPFREATRVEARRALAPPS